MPSQNKNQKELQRLARILTDKISDEFDVTKENREGEKYFSPESLERLILKVLENHQKEEDFKNGLQAR